MTSLIPWKRSGGNDPRMAPVSQMRSDWDRLFDRILDDVWSPTGLSQGMPLDVFESDEEIQVRAEVPGMNPEDLDISVAGDVLTLSGQKVDEEAPQGGSRYYSERQFGTYQRSVKLPCPVDLDRVSAEHRRGVVTISLQKAEAVRPRRIAVKSA